MNASALEHLPESSYIIDHYGLEPHPEGGYFTRTYQSEAVIPAGSLPQFPNDSRVCSTSIMYLLAAGQRSYLHRLQQDEIWHFYMGSPLRVIMISPQGHYSDKRLGPDLADGEHLQFVIPAGHWFGAKPVLPDAYSLLGCTVAPGFEYTDLEIARPDHLIGLCPNLQSLIKEFCRPEH